MEKAQKLLIEMKRKKLIGPYAIADAVVAILSRNNTASVLFQNMGYEAKA